MYIYEHKNRNNDHQTEAIVLHHPFLHTKNNSVYWNDLFSSITNIFCPSLECKRLLCR